MTNEEAIEVLDAMKVKVEIPKAAVTQHNRNVSLDMAIEALSKTKRDLSENDLISRRKAFEYFVTLWECIGTIMDRDEWEDVCMTTANEIPSAQPELIEKAAYIRGFEQGRTHGMIDSHGWKK